MPERIAVVPTPGNALNCCWREFSARSSRRVSDGPERMTVATPWALKSTLLTDGVSASAGNLERTPLTTRWTSTATRSAFAALVNWTLTTDTPDDETEAKPLESIFGNVAMASSMGRVTLASTVAGSAPGYVVVTTACGILMF